MAEINSQLSKETQRTLAELHETKYFQALTELCNEETAVVLDALLDKNKTEAQLRFYQGRAEEVKVLLERIVALHKAFMDDLKS